MLKIKNKKEEYWEYSQYYDRIGNISHYDNKDVLYINIMNKYKVIIKPLNDGLVRRDLNNILKVLSSKLFASMYRKNIRGQPLWLANSDNPFSSTNVFIVPLICVIGFVNFIFVFYKCE